MTVRVASSKGGTSKMRYLMLLLPLLWGGIHSLSHAQNHLYAATGSEPGYYLEVSKRQRALHVKQAGEGHIIKAYQIATGRGGPGSKQQRGDAMTPVGIYRIIGFRGKSKFHYFMHINYPNIIDAWQGYRNGVIDLQEYEGIARAYKNRVLPPQNTPLGGFLGIHGIGETTEKKLTIHEISDWTDGCIALTNQEINELRQYVQIGTPVVIRD